MEKDIDLSGVDPVRVPEIRRRVAILDEYVALHRPSAEVRRTYADRMNLSVSQLYHLARVWRISRRAASIPGARARFAEPRPRRLNSRSLGIARGVIDQLGPTAMRKSILAEVARQSAEAGVRPPSDSTVTNLLAAARTAPEQPLDVAPVILIDEATVKLPVRDGEAVTMPRVLLALRLPQRRIIAAEIACSSDTRPPVSALMRALDEQSDSGGEPLPIRAPHLGREDLCAIAAEDVSESGAVPQLSQVLGSRLGDIGLLYRARRARPGVTLAAARHASPLEEEDARRIIQEAIAAHNRSLAEPDTGFAIRRPLPA